jgi:hypothetical protein
MLDLYSMMLNEHDYARKLMCYVKNFEVSIERKFGGK